MGLFFVLFFRMGDSSDESVDGWVLFNYPPHEEGVSDTMCTFRNEPE